MIDYDSLLYTVCVVIVNIVWYNVVCGLCSYSEYSVV